MMSDEPQEELDVVRRFEVEARARGSSKNRTRGGLGKLVRERG